MSIFFDLGEIKVDYTNGSYYLYNDDNYGYLTNSCHNLNEHVAYFVGETKWVNKLIETNDTMDSSIVREVVYQLLADIYEHTKDETVRSRIAKYCCKKDNSNATKHSCKKCGSCKKEIKTGTVKEPVADNDKTVTIVSEPEMVNGPAHYNGTECIENMRRLYGDDAVRAFCICNAYKYRFRKGNKPNGSSTEDEAKAKWYENYVIKLMDADKTFY